ncbi:MAG: hypothetical protein ACYS47_11645 [Planctomycetota bacterium]
MGATWPWEGDLVKNFWSSKVKGTFTFKEVVEHEGELCARITGRVGGKPEGEAPLRCELLFSMKRKMPVSGSLTFVSKIRQESWKVKVADPAKKKPRKSATKGKKASR